MTRADDTIRFIESIAQEKQIDKESLFQAIEQAVAAAVSKRYGIDDLEMQLDRVSGQWQSNYEISLEEEGRILAQAVKQAIVVKVREAERDVIYEEYENQIGEIVNGTVQRFEGDTVIVNLGKNIEGILPRAEKVRGEIYNIGDRIRAMVLEVKKIGTRVKVILTRSHKDLVRCLFELEVPEIADGIIEIRRIEREPGYRTKLAVHSADDKVDCVGACVGVRGTRIKSIIDELGGERIDIIRWSQDSEALIANALKPAEVSHIELASDNSNKALVLVDEDQLSLAIGRKGQNVRLASKLSGWDIDIMTRAQLEEEIAQEEAAEKGEAVDGEADPEAELAEGVAVAEEELPEGGVPEGAPEDATMSGDTGGTEAEMETAAGDATVTVEPAATEPATDNGGEAEIAESQANGTSDQDNTQEVSSEAETEQANPDPARQPEN